MIEELEFLAPGEAPPPNSVVYEGNFFGELVEVYQRPDELFTWHRILIVETFPPQYDTLGQAVGGWTHRSQAVQDGLKANPGIKQVIIKLDSPTKEKPVSDIGPEDVVAAVQAIHDEPDDDKSLELERALLEETDKGDDHVPEEPLA